MLRSFKEPRLPFLGAVADHVDLICTLARAMPTGLALTMLHSVDQAFAEADAAGEEHTETPEKPARRASEPFEL